MAGTERVFDFESTMRLCTILLFVVGCQAGTSDDTCVGPQCAGAPDSGTEPVAACDDPATCVYEANCPPVVDPASLTSCGADAHCVPPALVPPDYASRLAKCM